jgi:hypothetical protein
LQLICDTFHKSTTLASGLALRRSRQAEPKGRLSTHRKKKITATVPGLARTQE